MTDQKIEEIRVRLAAKYATHSADLRADCHWLLTELDRLKAERVKLADDSRAARAFIAELKERMGCLFLERPEMTTARRVRAHVLGVIESFDRSNHD